MKEVDRNAYDAHLAALRAVQDLDPAVHKPGGIGRIEQWRTPDGRVCAWVQVDYWRGEEDVHFFIEAGAVPPA